MPRTFKAVRCKRYMAERQGFEPWRRSPAYTLSRRAPSTTRPPLRYGGFRLIALGISRGDWEIPASILKYQMNTSVLFALFLDFADRNASNFTCFGNMRAPTGLQINLLAYIADAHQTNAPCTARGLHRHCFHKSRICIQLCITDPAFGDIKITRDDRVQHFC